MKQRASRGTRSKEAEAIPRDLSLRSSTRSDSKISAPSGTSAADRDARVDRERIAASGVSGTPVKPGNLKVSGTPTTRKDVIDGFVHELLDRRWASADLVDHSFDNVVSISLAAKITLCFLRCGIISVKTEKGTVAPEDWPEACSHAASLARLASKAGKVTREMEQRYIWSWSAHLNTGTERGAQHFLNLIGFLAYVFGIVFELDTYNFSKRRLTTRITTLPRAYHRMPLESPDSQDCRPDFFALHRDAFVPNRENGREGEFMQKSSILLTIDTFWPKVRQKLPWLFSSLSQDVPNSRGRNEEEMISPLSFTPEGSDELLDDVMNGKYTGAKGDEDMDISSTEDESRDALSRQLKALLKALQDPSYNGIQALLPADVKDYGIASFLDLSRVSFPNVLIAGEGKQTDMRSAISQAMVYMRQQRRTQSWLRFCLGLMITKDKMGLLRADATGVEECVFPKNIGRGVIESIRLSLGILVATDQELGQHPSFSLRSVMKVIGEDGDDDINNDDHVQSAKKSKSKTSVSMSSGNEQKSKKVPSKAQTMPSSPTDSPPQPRGVWSREVNWITLDKEKLHGRLSDPVPNNFYVKYLIEDRGSLVGRCTRVWCVYQEVFESDPLLDRYRNEISKANRVLKGPYALKIYNADMFSEAYEQDILVKAMNIHRTKPLDGVLLPTHVWHFGDILFLVRGLTEDERPPTIPLDKMKNRQEIFTISALKRTLSQFETVEEFYHVIIGVLRGIESLEAIDIMHRDISFGNIIINEEIYCDTDKDFEWIYVDLDRVALVRRETVDIGASGGLHDLDMAAYIPKTAFNQKNIYPSTLAPPTVAPREPVLVIEKKPQRDLRTGTVPFMSIPLLFGGQHSVSDDLQSLFFVHYLSLFTFDQRLPNCFPNPPPPLRHRWPRAFKKWTDSVGKDMDELGSNKLTFFLAGNGSWYQSVKSDALSLWRKSTGDKAYKWAHWAMLGTFYDELWIRSQDEAFGNEDAIYQRKKGVTPSAIRTVLQKRLDSLDLNLEL